MRNAIWRIDYQNKQIEFQNVGKQFPSTKNNITIPMECEDFGSALIPLNVDGENLKCTFDSGSTGLINCAKKDLSLIPRSKNTADVQSTVTGLYGRSNRMVLEKKTDTIQFGDIQLTKKLIKFNENKSSVIGNKFWDNFNVIIDWNNCQLQLEKVKEIKKESLKVFQYSFAYDINNEKFSIGSQWKSHSLYKPIDNDHQILAIGEFSINEKIDFCKFLKIDYPILLEQDKLKIVVLEKGVKKEILLKKEILIGE